VNYLHADFNFSPFYIIFVELLVYMNISLNQHYYYYHLYCPCSTGALENKAKTATEQLFLNVILVIFAVV